MNACVSIYACFVAVFAHSENFHSVFSSRCCVPKTAKSNGMLQGEELVVRCAASKSIYWRTVPPPHPHYPPSTWLWEPMRKFWCWFHSLITGTLIHPLSCCKVGMLPQSSPPPPPRSPCSTQMSVCTWFTVKWLRLLRQLCSYNDVYSTLLPCSILWLCSVSLPVLVLFNMETEKWHHRAALGWYVRVWMVTKNP